MNYTSAFSLFRNDHFVLLLSSPERVYVTGIDFTGSFLIIIIKNTWNVYSISCNINIKAVNALGPYGDFYSKDVFFSLGTREVSAVRLYVPSQ